MELLFLCTPNSSTEFNFLNDHDINVETRGSNFFYLNKFMISEARSLFHINFLVIELDAIKDSHNEIIKCFNSIPLIYDFRVIFYSRKLLEFDSELFNLMIENKIYNMVYGEKTEDIREMMLKAVSEEGLSYDDHIKTDAEEGKVIYDYSNANNVRIAVTSLHNGAGCTSIAFQLANFIVRSSGRAAYSEVNESGHLSVIAEYYRLEQIKEGLFRHKDVDYYLDSGYSDGYNFTIFDFGYFDNYKDVIEVFKDFDIVLFVCGSKPYEVKNLSKLDFQKEFSENVLFNFCPDKLYLKDYEKENRDVHFLKYAPSLFNEGDNSEIYLSVLEKYKLVERVV